MNLNKALVIGNLTRDPEHKDLGTSQVCNFSIAMNRKFKDTEEVCFIDVVAWGSMATFAAKYFSKGKPVLVEGRIKQETWERDGKTNSKHVIVAERLEFVPVSTAPGSPVPESNAKASNTRVDKPRESKPRENTERPKQKSEDLFTVDESLPF